MSNIEAALFWVSTLAFAVTFFLAVLAIVFGKNAPQHVALRLFSGSVASLLGLGVARWVRTGHPPFVTIFESMTFSVFLFVLIYNIIRLRQPRAGAALAPAAGISLLLMGWSLSLPHEATPLSAALDNVWLFIHASFATAGAAVFLVAAAFSAAYLMGPQRLARLRLPGANGDLAGIPKSVSTFLLMGFIMWGTMIASGAIWAHVAWGRYWGWDPVELWSLISWVLYALLIHARLTFKLPARVFCILTIVTAGTVAFSLWGIQYVYDTIHTYG
jgi:ABC-type transport system involved in cytochrome c biogenesis permease subunit